MGMDFTKLLQEWNTLAHGAPQIALPEGGDISGLGQALEEQQDDMVLVLSNLPHEMLEELEVAVAQAAAGYVQAGESFAALRAFGKVLSESQNYEVPKVGDAILRVSNTYETIGQSYKSLLRSVRRARQLDTQN